VCVLPCEASLRPSEDSSWNLRSLHPLSTVDARIPRLKHTVVNPSQQRTRLFGEAIVCNVVDARRYIAYCIVDYIESGCRLSALASRIISTMNNGYNGDDIHILNKQNITDLKSR